MIPWILARVVPEHHWSWLKNTKKKVLVNSDTILQSIVCLSGKTNLSIYHSFSISLVGFWKGGKLLVVCGWWTGFSLFFLKKIDFSNFYFSEKRKAIQVSLVVSLTYTSQSLLCKSKLVFLVGFNSEPCFNFCLLFCIWLFFLTSLSSFLHLVIFSFVVFTVGLVGREA